MTTDPKPSERCLACNNTGRMQTTDDNYRVCYVACSNGCKAPEPTPEEKAKIEEAAGYSIDWSLVRASGEKPSEPPSKDFNVAEDDAKKRGEILTGDSEPTSEAPYAITDVERWCTHSIRAHMDQLTLHPARLAAALAKLREERDEAKATKDTHKEREQQAILQLEAAEARAERLAEALRHVRAKTWKHWEDTHTRHSGNANEDTFATKAHAIAVCDCIDAALTAPATIPSQVPETCKATEASQVSLVNPDAREGA